MYVSEPGRVRTRIPSGFIFLLAMEKNSREKSRFVCNS
jgi:hypothetical protein